MADIALLYPATIVNYTSKDGVTHTGKIIGRLMGGHLEGEVDLDEASDGHQHSVDAVKVQFDEKDGAPPELPSITCPAADVDIVDVKIMV